ncbi:MAG: family 78 glycoside hydrolase catalytic domain [Verrucomicrobia bacterium]|nr:family 78 glycoside hydrolase catalytic domain [Verrucomicrobiota bacterium]
MKQTQTPLNHGLGFLVTAFLGFLSGFNATGASGIHAVALRCEYATAPHAVDAPQPRLSWVVQATPGQRRVVQSAYRVLVASRPELLAQNQGDFWDSGQVRSDQSVHVVYGGKALHSRQACFWRVQLWDQDGAASAWSETARWTMGLLRPADWQASWIGFKPAAETEDAAGQIMRRLLRLSDHHWVWVSGSKAGNQPAGKAHFRKVVQLPPDRKVDQASVLLTADDGFVLYVNGHPAGQGSTWKTLANVEITGRLRPGANAIGIEAVNGGDTPTPAGVVGRVIIVFESGDPLVLPIDGTWQSSRSAGERWSWADYDAAGWQPAASIAPFGAQPWGAIRVEIPNMQPAPFFRKSFTVGKPVRRALLYASALGVYELRLNGTPVDTDVLSPGWSDYRKRVHYFGYDVTRHVRQGQNALGALLGDGWYAGYLAFTGKRRYYGDEPRLLAQLHIDYADGTQEVVGTDGSWKAATGPIRQNDMLMGCVYDARQEMPGWDAPGFHDTAWHPAQVDTSVKASLEAHPGPPIRRVEELPAQTLTEPRPGVSVFDLGQNMVGWVRLMARGDAGQKVVVRHGEMLNPDGSLYTVNLRAAKATDTYHLAGGGKRAYEPHFTFHGFRYVEVTGLAYRPEPQDVTGIVAHSDLPRTGWFECSEPLLNKLTLNSLWGQKGNFLDVPTDCPQRDERAGWTGDAEVFMKTACFNMDAAGFYTKWLVDLCQDSQRADGAFGDVAPHLSVVGYGNAGWTDAGPICAWRMYEMYGDTRVLRHHYPALRRHAEYLVKSSKDFVRDAGAYGDWLCLSGPQRSEVVGTAYFYYTVCLMEKIAGVLGETRDARQYHDLAENIRRTFQIRFIKPDGRIADAKNETGQTFYAVAFGLGLVPDQLKTQTAHHFAAQLKTQHDHLATGFLGTPFVLFALQNAGRPDLAYKLVLNRTYPSWLQQVLWGSTTMWERWDGWRPDKGFQDPGMNSFNHYWLGCVNEWLFTQVAGMDTDGPGFRHITLRPEIRTPPAGLSWAKAAYVSIRGRIATAWRIDEGRWTLEATVPANCDATVYMPATSAQRVTESGQPVAQAEGVQFLRQEPGMAVFKIGSGRYVFESQP